MKRLLLLTLALFSVALQAADVRYYDVEVIIFEHLQADSRTAEQWPQQMNRKVPETLIELGGSWPGGKPEDYISALSFKSLSKRKWRLMDEAEKINKSDSRRLLTHVAWVQPGLAKDQAISVHINRAVLSKDKNVKTKTGTPEQPAKEYDSGTLDALIRVSLARYLRVEADLLFTLDDKSIRAKTENEVATPHYFHAQQLRRRIRSTELHYLDHPVLGMLIMFTPHKVAAKAAAKKK